MPLVAVVMGSKSDAEALQPTLEILTQLGIEHEVNVISAHRTPEKARKFAQEARERGIEVIIAAAGMAAHLAGACAANTTLPVIGLPLSGGALNGVDALYATVQMPRGIPVATVAVDGAVNAALLAVQILAVTDPGLVDALAADREARAAVS